MWKGQSLLTNFPIWLQSKPPQMKQIQVPWREPFRPVTLGSWGSHRPCGVWSMPLRQHGAGEPLRPLDPARAETETHHSFQVVWNPITCSIRSLYFLRQGLVSISLPSRPNEPHLRQARTETEAWKLFLDSHRPLCCQESQKRNNSLPRNYSSQGFPSTCLGQSL